MCMEFSYAPRFNRKNRALACITVYPSFGIGYQPFYDLVIYLIVGNGIKGTAYVHIGYTACGSDIDITVLIFRKGSYGRGF